ncbi:hypothetical protein MMC17_008850 [Xylographa soralifera]|nr:hypothetical protein [Xylographa soralifera]
MGFSQLEVEVLEAISRENNPLPGIVLAAASLNGKVHYYNSFGHTGIKEGSTPMTVDTPLYLASATKLITCVAAARCVQDGLVALDDDLTKILPELKDLQVIKGYDANEKVELEPVHETITFRQLITHTFGMASLENEKLARYYMAIGDPEKATFLMRYFGGDDGAREALLPQLRKAVKSFPIEPLLFQPGKGWVYGHGFEWVGLVIERVSKLSLEDYCQKYIFQPLRMSSSTFRASSYPEVYERIPQLFMRTVSGNLMPTPVFLGDGPPDMGGSGLVSTAKDFMKLLASLLHNDGKVLKPETTDLMLNARVSDRSIFEVKEVKEMLDDEVGPGGRADHCLAGCVNVDPIKETGRHAGSVFWAGATCCYWWLDRSAGVCGFYGSQILAARDGGVSRKMFQRFEKAVYDNLQSSEQ